MVYPLTIYLSTHIQSAPAFPFAQMSKPIILAAIAVSLGGMIKAAFFQKDLKSALLRFIFGFALAVAFGLI